MKGKNTKWWYYSSFLPLPRTTPLCIGAAGLGGGGLFISAGNWAFLSKTLEKTHFHSCRNTVRSLSNPRAVIIAQEGGK